MLPAQHLYVNLTSGLKHSKVWAVTAGLADIYLKTLIKLHILTIFNRELQYWA